MKASDAKIIINGVEIVGVDEKDISNKESFVCDKCGSINSACYTSKPEMSRACLKCGCLKDEVK